MNAKKSRILDIGYDKEQKILAKLYSIILTRTIIGLKPVIKIPEFKHIISSYKIPVNQWFNLAKKFEEKKYLIRYRNNEGLLIHLNSETLLSLYQNQHYISLSKHPELISKHR